MDQTHAFEAERGRLLALASRMLGERAEAEDVVQQAWMRLHRAGAGIENVPAWLTTVTTRLCLDRLRARVPLPRAEITLREVAPDPAEEVALAETVGIALQVLLEHLTPAERVAFVLHDSFGYDFSTIASILATTPVAARKLASRARAKVAQPRGEDPLADWEVVDAFMAAAREGDFTALLRLLAPEAAITADDAAILTGTPQHVQGQREVATFFTGGAHAALEVLLDDRPGVAWFHRGQAMVAFDFTITGGLVHQITFRAAPEVLARVVRRKGAAPRPTGAVGGHTSRAANVKEDKPADSTSPKENAHEDDDLPPAGRPLRPGPPR